MTPKFSHDVSPLLPTFPPTTHSSLLSFISFFSSSLLSSFLPFFSHTHTTSHSQSTLPLSPAIDPVTCHPQHPALPSLSPIYFSIVALSSRWLHPWQPHHQQQAHLQALTPVTTPLISNPPPMATHHHRCQSTMYHHSLIGQLFSPSQG